MNNSNPIKKNWNGEDLITVIDQQTDSHILIAIHTTQNGRSAGGLRMKRYDSREAALSDVLNLSEAMTHKFAISNMKWGGAKSVIYLTRDLDGNERKQLLIRFGLILKNLQGRYYVGPDVGTSSEDMNIIYETGKPYVFSRTIEAGGAGSSSIPTAYGVFAGIKTTCKFIFGTDQLKGRSILIQGLGSVGQCLQNLLEQENAIIYYTETNQETIDQVSSKRIHAHFIHPEKIYDREYDIFSPCAHGGILNKNSIQQLKCKGIVGAANNQLQIEEDADFLKLRGILYAPDYVVNLGGAMGITSIEAEGFTEIEIIEKIQSTIMETLEEVYITANADDTNTVKAALKIAQKRLKYTIDF